MEGHSWYSAYSNFCVFIYCILIGKYRILPSEYSLCPAHIVVLKLVLDVKHFIDCGVYFAYLSKITNFICSYPFFFFLNVPVSLSLIYKP